MKRFRFRYQQLLRFRARRRDEAELRLQEIHRQAQAKRASIASCDQRLKKLSATIAASGNEPATMLSSLSQLMTERRRVEAELAELEEQQQNAHKHLRQCAIETESLQLLRQQQQRQHGYAAQKAEADEQEHRNLTSWQDVQQKSMSPTRRADQ